MSRVPPRCAIAEVAITSRCPCGSISCTLIANAETKARASITRSDGDDVDDRGERVGTVERGPRTANNLDAFDLIDVDAERFPKGRSENVVVGRALSVDEDQELVAQTAVESAHRHVRVAASDLHDVNSRHTTRKTGDARYTGQTDVLARDDGGGVG